jgi:hypothetical protein
MEDVRGNINLVLQQNEVKMALIRGNYADGNGNKTGVKGRLLKCLLCTVCVILLWNTACWSDQKGML